ncbi:MAG: hypothetical protein HXX19_00190 [Rhodoferax sp.]|nr:hypothetical protein [Rhodoferax sp.]
MTRNADRLEVLARDLASRYGEEDRVVCAIRRNAPVKLVPVGMGHQIWRVTHRPSFQHARLTKLGIGSAA